jgi:hypothetical protein
VTDLVLENGLTVPKLAASCMRTFWLCTRGKTSSTYNAAETEDFVPDAGWLELAAVAMSYYVASDEDLVSLTVTQLAEQLRNAFYRGRDAAELGPASLPPAFDTLPVRQRLAWEMVARHAAGATNADDEEVERLEGFEPAWGDVLIQKAADRRLTLEPAESAS